MFDFEKKLPHWINRTGYMIRTRAEKEMADAGHPLTAEEWAVLMVLWRDGPQTMSRLATLTIRDRTTMTRLVDRMLAKELVVRHHGTIDRRQIQIAPSPKAEKSRKAIIRAIEKTVSASCRSIEKRRLKDTLEVLSLIAKNLEAED